MEINKYKSEEIINAINNETNCFAKKKLQAVLLIKEGVSVNDVSIKLSRHVSRIYIWIKQVNSEGLLNLKIKKGRGRKSLLSEKQLKHLKKTISKPIKTNDGYSRGWQSKDVYQYILKKYNIGYSLIRIREILRSFEFRKITCRPRSKRRNEKLTQEFLQNVKKKEIYWIPNIS